MFECKCWGHWTSGRSLHASGAHMHHHHHITPHDERAQYQWRLREDGGPPSNGGTKLSQKPACLHCELHPCPQTEQFRAAAGVHARAHARTRTEGAPWDTHANEERGTKVTQHLPAWVHESGPQQVQTSEQQRAPCTGHSQRGVAYSSKKPEEGAIQMTDPRPPMEPMIRYTAVRAV